jgi:predicted SpoU family rRNA methylase
MVVCDKECCPWRVCARKQKVSEKWKIIRVVGPHSCASHDLSMKHRQLTSTLIAKRLMKVLLVEPNMKVRTIIKIVNEFYGGYDITYGKDWRAKQRTWKMIYGD